MCRRTKGLGRTGRAPPSPTPTQRGGSVCLPDTQVCPIVPPAVASLTWSRGLFRLSPPQGPQQTQKTTSHKHPQVLISTIDFQLLFVVGGGPASPNCCGLWGEPSGRQRPVFPSRCRVRPLFEIAIVVGQIGQHLQDDRDQGPHHNRRESGQSASFNPWALARAPPSNTHVTASGRVLIEWHSSTNRNFQSFDF